MQFFKRPNSEGRPAPDAARLSDSQLLEQFVEHRDQDAFESLVRIHGPMVLGVCRRVTGHHHDAEEAFQAAFLVLARKAASIWPRHMLASWLYGVAYRTALKLRTATAKRRAKEKQTAMLPEPVAPQERDWQEIDPLLDRELNRLPAAYRAAVICCDLQGHSRTDAARQLGWPEGTLKVRLMRAHSILAKRLTRQGVTLSAGTLAVVLSQKAASAAVPAALLSSTAKAAGATAATSGASASAGAKTAALAKGIVKSAFLSKAAVAAAVGGVTLAAAVAITPPKKKPHEPPPAATRMMAPPAAKLTTALPAVVEQALRENARQLCPLSVTCTEQMSSRLSPAETFDRLKSNRRTDGFFDARESRILWQDDQVFSSFKSPIGSSGDKTSTAQLDALYDGASRVVLEGLTQTLSKELFDQQKKKRRDTAPVRHSLTKEPLTSVFERMAAGQVAFRMAYFQPAMGIVLAPSSGTGLAGGPRQPKLSADSAVLADLSRGWKLISVGSTQLEGRSLVRIDLEGDNTVRTGALATLGYTHPNVQWATQRKEMLRGSPDERLKLVEAWLKLPTTRRYTFYLDPQLHYAVRRLDQSYGETLVSRSDCSQFERIPGRELWLPQKIETQLHEFPSLPGTIFADSFLTSTTTVSSMSGDRISAVAFKLDYETVPGTTIRDGTVRARSSKTGNGYVTYTVPARPGDLPQVIARAMNGGNIVQFPGGQPFAAEPIAERFRSGSLRTILLCNLGLLGATAAYLAWRRKRSATVFSSRWR